MRMVPGCWRGAALAFGLSSVGLILRFRKRRGVGRMIRWRMCGCSIGLAMMLVVALGVMVLLRRCVGCCWWRVWVLVVVVLIMRVVIRRLTLICWMDYCRLLVCRIRLRVVILIMVLSGLLNSVVSRVLRCCLVVIRFVCARTCGVWVVSPRRLVILILFIFGLIRLI